MTINDFLTRGPEEETPQAFSLLGVRFISIASSIEMIGEIVQVVDSILTVNDPIAITRDTKNINKFNFIKIKKANPIVQDVIYVPISSIAFMCIPSDQFLKNYLVSRTGLVSPPAALVFDGEGLSVKL